MLLQYSLVFLITDLHAFHSPFTALWYVVERPCFKAGLSWWEICGLLFYFKLTWNEEHVEPRGSEIGLLVRKRSLELCAWVVVHEKQYCHTFSHMTRSAETSNVPLVRSLTANDVLLADVLDQAFVLTSCSQRIAREMTNRNQRATISVCSLQVGRNDASEMQRFKPLHTGGEEFVTPMQ